jgi:hypothetical protein
MAADAFSVDIFGKGYHFLCLAESAFEQQAIVFNPEGNCLCHRSLFIHDGLDGRPGGLCTGCRGIQWYTIAHDPKKLQYI